MYIILVFLLFNRFSYSWLYKQNKKAAEEENLDEEQKVQFLKNGNLKKEHSEECGG